MNEKSDLKKLCDLLEKAATSTNAKKALVEFTRPNGDIFRIEYKCAKKN